MKYPNNTKIRVTARAITLAAAILVLVSLPSGGAGLEQNDEWILKKTPLFDIYCPKDFAYRYNDMLKAIGRAYNRCCDLFRFRPRSVISIVLYGDQVPASAPGELKIGASGSYYDPGKKAKVSIPFSADEGDFFMACTHELAKALMIDCLESRAGSLGWFIEGAAWYSALGFNAEAAIVLGSRAGAGTATGLGYIPQAGGYQGRCLVQGFLNFLETEYGPDALRMLDERLREHGDFSKAVLSVTGLSLYECDRRFALFLSERLPAGRAAISSAPLAPRSVEPYFLAVPLYSEGRTRLIFMERGLDSWSLCVSREDKRAPGNSPKQIAAGRMDEFYSSAPYINRRATVSAGGSIFAYTEHTGSGETVFIRNADNASLLAEKTMPFRAVYDPALSRDGGLLVFSGFTARGSDLYIYDWKKNSLERITSDSAEERFPAFTADGAGVLFSRRDSRPEGQGRYAIFIARLAGGGIDPVHADGGDDLHPSQSQDGRRIIFTSIGNGYPLLKMYETETGSSSAIPESGWAMFPRFSSDGSIVFSRFDGHGFSVYGM